MSAPASSSVVGGESLPGDAALGEVAPGLGHALGACASFWRQASSPTVQIIGSCVMRVALQGGQAQALHHGVGVLDAVAQRAGGRVHQHAIERQAHVADEDVELLRQVDVDRARAITTWPLPSAAATIVR